MNGDVGHSDPEPPSLPRKVLLERGSEGYGFNLHGEKGIHGQFISAIDEGSPAQQADVRVGDRVIAVNDEDVEDLPHSKVVERIRAGGNKVTLLLVDEECDRFYKNLSLKIPQDKFETVPAMNAPQEIAEEPVANGDEEVKNGEVSETDSGPKPTEVPEEKNITETEEGDEDANEYEEVIPLAPSVPTEKPAESTMPDTTVEEQANTTPDSTVEEQANTIPPSTTTTVEQAPPKDQNTSPEFDMAAARPKPRRNEVKHANQNWKQKYEDFNKL